MGTEKALLPIQGKSLIDTAIAQARTICEDIFIVGPKETFAPYGRIVKDVYPGCGPLGGIHAALGRSQTKLNLMMAVDTPLVSSEFVAHLAEVARSANAIVTLPRTAQGLQPLCAIYRTDFLPIAEKALKEGRLKLDALFHPATTRVIDVENDEMRLLGFTAALFDNLNTREDYERVIREKTRHANS